jgi:hypothetical protein
MRCSFRKAPLATYGGSSTGALLVDLWDELLLPAEIRATWEPLVLLAHGWA